jgi:hypothetical protein
MTSPQTGSHGFRLGRRQLIHNAGLGSAALAMASSWRPSTTAAQPMELPPFDIFNEYAPIGLVIPTIIPQVYQHVSPGASDATLVLRITALVTNAWFDAIAPYHPTAVGVYSRIDRQPASEATTLNKNIAILFASHRVLASLMPRQIAAWDDMLRSVGLDPTSENQDTTNPVGIGNVAGTAIVEARENDGMNQLGNFEGRYYHARPYANCDGYAPVNTAYELTDPARWQPQIISTGNGLFTVQQCVTPQIRSTTPYSYTDPAAFPADPPAKSDPGTPDYKAQADEVLAASAALTDEQKMVCEIFDDKFRGVGFATLFVAESRKLTLDELLQYDFLCIMAAFDAVIAVWYEKLRHDAVRPASAIAWLYGDSPVTAWGGPGMGRVSDLPANQWRSYLQTADHPEYPSGSAAICGAQAEASRLFLGTDEFGWTIPIAAGSSGIEPGITPAEDIILGPWETWTDFENVCGESRVWGGVHFPAAVPAGRAIGHDVGRRAWEFVQAHLAGDA